MRIVFVPRTDGPQNLITGVELHFDEPGIAGLKLIGFSMWRGKDKQSYVTFPARVRGERNDRKYFDFLCSVDDKAESVERLKGLILAEWDKQVQISKE